MTGFGWIRRTKGYERIIEVLPNLPEETVFVTAGGTLNEEGEDHRRELRNRAEELGVGDRIRITGCVPDDMYPTVMNATDVMVLPYTRIPVLPISSRDP